MTPMTRRVTGRPTVAIRQIMRSDPLWFAEATACRRAHRRPWPGEACHRIGLLLTAWIALAAGGAHAEPPAIAPVKPAETESDLGRAIDLAKLSAAKVKSSNNMKMILLALLSYEAANGCFPPAVVLGPDGRPWHSWRVLVLPYLEGGSDVYEAYDFSLPWNAEANLAVARRHIPAYRNPFDNTDSGAAGYAVILSDDGVFPPAGATMRDASDRGFRARGTKLREIGDGTSSTACLVPIDAAAGKPWTEPKDVPVVAATRAADGGIQLVSAAGQDKSAYFSVGLCDGSIRTLPATSAETVLRVLTSRAGGERIDQATWTVAPGEQRAQMPAKNPAAREMSVLDLSDADAVRRAMGGRVTVEAVVHSVSWTTQQNAVNIELAGPEDDRLLVWINPGVTAKLVGGAVDPARDEFMGRRLRVTGLLGPYGGRSKRFEGRKQITVDSPADIAFAESDGDDPEE
jgi:hypothetical protein